MTKGKDTIKTNSTPLKGFSVYGMFFGSYCDFFSADKVQGLAYYGTVLPTLVKARIKVENHEWFVAGIQFFWSKTGISWTKLFFLMRDTEKFSNYN